MWDFAQSKLTFTNIQTHFPTCIECGQRQFQKGIVHINSRDTSRYANDTHRYDGR